ncbi:polysaccharide biosynthesis/export family protein [Sulfurimonas sp. HSL-1656]|uniref:polysaccharide biosynthesis/export family protein n=1 Tax=Thiomicrolovo subterrani TaxID=3131934 RepID=UPI0031F9AB4C
MPLRLLTIMTAVSLFLLSGCSMKEYRLFQDDNLSDETTAVSAAEYRDEMVFENIIAPNDRVAVMVYNQSSTDSRQMTSMVSSRGGMSGASSAGRDETLGLLVTQEGTVRLPLIGRQKITGMTEDEAANFLITQYQKYLRNPYVTVEIMNQRIFVLGEVKDPGVVPVTNGMMNLIEALARSNDLTDYADRTSIKIIRGDLRAPDVRVVDLTQMSAIRLTSLYLKPNDIVYVQPRAMKGYNMAFNEIAPPFQLLSSILQPFVNIVYLQKALE